MKIRGNIIFTFSILTMLLLFSLKTYSITSIHTCFNDSGADFVKSQIEGYAIIDTADSPEASANRILKSLDVKKDVSGYWDDQMYIIEFSEDDINVIIKSKEIQPKKKVYTSVALSQYKDSVNINNVWRTAVKAFSYYSVQPFCSSFISGKFNGRLSKNEMETKVKEIFLKNNIKSIDKMSENNMISLCGYMAGINDYIVVNEKKINVNIALRYSETYSCTYITIGSPIIAVEY